MKKLLKIVGVLVVLVILVAVAVPFFIPAETYKNEVIRQVQAHTGRTLSIDGEVKASLFPSIGVQLGQVALSNGQGFSNTPMVKLQDMTVEVALVPLLSGEVQLKRFVLNQPIINLEVNAQGKPNWEFTPAPKVAAAAPSFALIASAQADEPKTKDALAALQRLQLGEVKIIDGTVLYSDKKSRTEQKLSNVNVEIGLKRIDEPFTLAGDAIWNAQKVNLDAKVSTLQTLLSGQETPVKLTIDTTHAKVDFDGSASLQHARGAVNVSSPSLVGLASWTGSAFAWKGQGPLAFSAKGGLSCTPTKCSFTNADIALDALKMKGELGVNVGGSVPQLTGQLATDVLNANPFMAADTAAGQHSVLEWLVSSAHAQSSGGWSTDPIDLSGLKAANADLLLTAGDVLVQKIKLGKTALKIALNGGVLKLDLPQMALYGGNGKGAFTVTSGNQISAQFALAGMQAEPFLKDATGDDRLSGTTELNLAISTQGASQQQLVNALSGNGNVKFTDGALKGINIAQFVRDVKTAFIKKQDVSEKTDFAELGGTFTIANGIISNSDLAMKAPLLRLSGQGNVSLPAMTVNYRLLPSLVNSIKGQGGKEKEGLTIPIIVEGPLSQPSYRPDLASTVQDVINDPEKAKQTLKDLKAGLKEGKGDLKETLKENKAGLKDLKNNPDALKGLLNGLGR